MRYSFTIATLVALATAFPSLNPQSKTESFVVELAPGEAKSVTKAEKFALIDEGVGFIDVTDWPRPPKSFVHRLQVTYPTELTQGGSVQDLIKQLNATNIQTNLEAFSSFNNRYYQSETGNQSAEWLLAQARGQSSIIATIPGKSAKTIVVGAHQDSINGEAGGNRTTARAPGADDNGSGSMTILEAFRTLLTNSTIATGQAPHTIEFHWYAGEEAGLLGSGNVFRAYAEQNRDIAAMLNQDMTCYTAGYTSRNMTPKFGIVTDGTDVLLTEFVRRIIGAYTKTEASDTECGYACSDHTSATRAGYPSAFVFEGEMHGPNDNPYVHTANDTIEKVDFEHTIEHAKLVLGFVVELAFASL
ncbi:Nn.00g065510.m01.CDS01 [Neocucurbitaria sp. VM-36]